MNPVRGRVYRVDVGYGLKLWLCVSNNHRNNVTQDWLGVRLTTTDKAGIPSAVPLKDPIFTGYVLCDNIMTVYREDIHSDVGALRRSDMESVGEALKIALGIT